MPGILVNRVIYVEKCSQSYKQEYADHRMRRVVEQEQVRIGV